MPIYSKPTKFPEWGSDNTPINSWQASTAYAEAAAVTNNGSVYVCTGAGTSAASGGPSGTDSSITDGTAEWRWSRFQGTAGPMVEPSDTLRGRGFGSNPIRWSAGALNWLINNVYGWILYLSTITATKLTFTAPLTLSQTVSATNVAPSAWQSSTAYTVDTLVTNDSGKVYICITAGTSASSGGPTGTGSSITDGTAAWMYLRASASPAILGTSSVSGQPGVKGVGDGTGAAPGLGTGDVIQLALLASDPSAPTEGQIWYNSTSHTWKGRVNGSTVTFTTS
jgi:hypothetical protein